MTGFGDDSARVLSLQKRVHGGTGGSLRWIKDGPVSSAERAYSSPGRAGAGALIRGLMSGYNVAVLGWSQVRVSVGTFEFGPHFHSSIRQREVA